MNTSIVINGYAFQAESVADLLQRVFWKQISDVDLNTADGCRKAAEVAVRWMAVVGLDYHPGAVSQQQEGQQP